MAGKHQKRFFCPQKVMICLALKPWEASDVHAVLIKFHSFLLNRSSITWNWGNVEWIYFSPRYRRPRGTDLAAAQAHMGKAGHRVWIRNKADDMISTRGGSLCWFHPSWFKSWHSTIPCSLFCCCWESRLPEAAGTAWCELNQLGWDSSPCPVSRRPGSPGSPHLDWK